MYSHYANAFNSTKGSSVVQAAITAEKLPQNVFDKTVERENNSLLKALKREFNK